MKKYKCRKCGWVYDPVKGDPLSNIPPQTPFDDLPEEWVCPRCYFPKTQFEKM